MNGIFNFNGRSKEGGVLSNFHKGLVVMDDKKFPSGEAAFQAAKYFHASKNLQNNDEKRKRELLEYGEKFEIGGTFSALSSADIKQKGGKKGFPLHSSELKNWGEEGENLQRKICRYKFENDEKVAQCLMNHMNEVLVHPSRVGDDKIVFRVWEGRGKIVDGKVVVLGGNVLGNLWMEIREELVV